MKHTTIKLFFSIFTMMAIGAATAQDKDAAAVKKMVEERNFVFKAQFASPQTSRNINLTSEYDLTVRPDSVVSFLPYFGRAYVAPVNPTEGGIKFTSTNFEYKQVKRNKNGWDILIKTRDITDAQELYLTIFDNSSASLRVNSNNRQGISFTGYVTEGRPANKKAF